MPELKVFHNDVDWVVAESAEDATKLLAEHNSCPVEKLDEDSLYWDEWANDRVLVIDDDGTKISKTCSQWACGGRAYIGSTEY